MSMFVVQTDAPCRMCGARHEYVTRGCDLVVFVHYSSANWMAFNIEGSVVREIQEVPEGISYHMFTHKGGRPDPSLPSNVPSSVS